MGLQGFCVAGFRGFGFGWVGGTGSRLETTLNAVPLFEGAAERRRLTGGCGVVFYVEVPYQRFYLIERCRKTTTALSLSVSRSTNRLVVMLPTRPSVGNACPLGLILLMFARVLWMYLAFSFLCDESDWVLY